MRRGVLEGFLQSNKPPPSSSSESNSPLTVDLAIICWAEAAISTAPMPPAGAAEGGGDAPTAADPAPPGDGLGLVGDEVTDKAGFWFLVGTKLFGFWSPHQKPNQKIWCVFGPDLHRTRWGGKDRN